MKTLALLIVSLTLASANAATLKNDITSQIPVIEKQLAGFTKIKDVAQYKQADWSQVIGIANNVDLSEAAQIATTQYPEATFFFHVKGMQMVLETEEGDYRIFKHGDAVFFKGEPWWGSAPGLSDGYIKQ